MAPSVKPLRISKPESTKKRAPKDVPQLLPTRVGVNIEDDMNGESPNEDAIRSGIKRLLSIQWGPLPEQLSPDFREHISKFHKFVPRLVSRSQLYSLFPNEQSSVDKEVEKLLKRHEVRRITTQNVQLKGDLLMLSEDYTAFIEKQIAVSKSNAPLLTKFLTFVNDPKNDVSHNISKATLTQFTDEEIKTLTQLEYISLVVRETDYVALSIPRFGFITALYLKAKTFTTRAMSTTKWKEITHMALVEKWEKNKAKFKDFKGVTLQWVLHFLIGEGVLEAFDTMQGRAYKLL